MKVSSLIYVLPIKIPNTNVVKFFRGEKIPSHVVSPCFCSTILFSY